MMRAWMLSFTAAFLASLAGCAVSAVADAELSGDQRVLKQLEFHKSYDKFARPPPDYNTTNVVHFDFFAQKILDINAVGQSMTIEGFIRMAWTDRRLAWADKFNATSSNVSNIYLPRSSVWIPDVITINTMEHNENKWVSLFTFVTAEGRIFISTPFCSRTFCDIDMQYFPFDTQTCKVIFGSWLMHKEDLELRALPKNISDLAFDLNRQTNFDSDEYCIMKREFAVTPKEKVGRFQEAQFAVSIQRKPLFYVMNLILPSFLILTICVFSFFLPPESGERLSLNITMMLALTVFMQIVAASTPAQSDKVPILTMFFAAVMGLSAMSAVGSLVNIYCHFKAQACLTVGNAAIRLVFLWRLGGASRAAAGRREEKTNLGAESPEEQALGPQDKSGEQGDDEGGCVRGPGHPGESEWRTVGRRLDNGVFAVMVISTAALGLFICLVRNPDYVAC